MSADLKLASLCTDAVNAFIEACGDGEYPPSLSGLLDVESNNLPTWETDGYESWPVIRHGLVTAWGERES